MSNHEKLTAALLAVFEMDEHDKATAAGALAGVLVALQEPVLVELRKQNTLLEVIAKQGDRALHVGINGPAGGVFGGGAFGGAISASGSGLPG